MSDTDTQTLPPPSTPAPSGPLPDDVRTGRLDRLRRPGLLQTAVVGVVAVLVGALLGFGLGRATGGDDGPGGFGGPGGPGGFRGGPQGQQFGGQQGQQFGGPGGQQGQQFGGPGGQQGQQFGQQTQPSGVPSAS